MVSLPLSFPRLTVPAWYWRVLVVCIFIIAKIPSKSISSSHFRTQKISSIFVHRCQHLGYKSVFSPKKTTALVYAVVFSAFM